MDTIRSLVERTPLVYSRLLSQLAGVSVYLKLENLQTTGSFKVRGAFNRLLRPTAEERQGPEGSQEESGKSINPKIRVIGVTAAARPTVTDGIAVKSPGRKTRRLLKRYVDQMITVNEEEIAEAILLLMEHATIITEDAAVVS